MGLTISQERMDRIKLSAAVFAKFFGMSAQFKEAILVQMKFEGTTLAGETGMGGARDALKHYFSDDGVIIWINQHLRVRYDVQEDDPWVEVSGELKYNGLWQGRLCHLNIYEKLWGTAGAGLTSPNGWSKDMFFPNIMVPVEEDDYVQMDLGINENTGNQDIAVRCDINFLYFEKP